MRAGGVAGADPEIDLPMTPDGELAGGPVNTAIPVADASQIGEARRAARVAGDRAGLSSDELGRLGLIVTEAATNLARHATDGVMIVRNVGTGGSAGVEVLAIDRGPGIADLARAMEDGYSTAGTPGKGLGAIRRLAPGAFDIISTSQGTVMMARVRSSREPVNGEADAGVICIPITGETMCGDAWHIDWTRDRTLVVVVDGLGHGPEAAVAASTAIRVIQERGDTMPGALLQAVHNALRPTRGAAISIARVDRRTRMVTLAGVGNVAASICDTTQTRQMATLGGIAGHQIASMREFEYPWPEQGYLVMHSDGISGRWRTDAYPGVMTGDPALLAAVLFRDFGRGRDDTTVVVVRDRPNPV
jgi:anti-sigma regulatory factor (Ser/Thr protein kinase)